MAKVNLVTILAILAAIFVMVIDARSTSATGDVKIVKFNQIQDETSYKFEFENSDGQKRYEAGVVKEESEGGNTVYGQYSYLGQDNRLYTVTYEAGRNGFKPTITVA